MFDCAMIPDQLSIVALVIVVGNHLSTKAYTDRLLQSFPKTVRHELLRTAYSP